MQMEKYKVISESHFMSYTFYPTLLSHFIYFLIILFYNCILTFVHFNLKLILKNLDYFKK